LFDGDGYAFDDVEGVMWYNKASPSVDKERLRWERAVRLPSGTIATAWLHDD
jgi:hypothetical protein